MPKTRQTILVKELAKLQTDDYQHREGSYPKSGIPDSIRVLGRTVTAEFKNTSESQAARWLERHLENLGFTLKSKAEAFQSGDYDDDWVTASATVSAFHN